MPTALRPNFPASYGIAEGAEGQLDWSWAVERLIASELLGHHSRWERAPARVAGVGAMARRRARLRTSPESRKAKNLIRDPRVVVHLESGDEVVVVGQDRARADRRWDRRRLQGQVRLPAGAGRRLVLAAAVLSARLDRASTPRRRRASRSISGQSSFRAQPDRLAASRKRTDRRRQPSVRRRARRRADPGIDDTDAARTDPGEEVVTDLEWLGVRWEEGPVRQSERAELYSAAAKRLLDEEHAYEDEGAIRFREERRPTLLRADGRATYQLASVVDDLDLGITHVIRGKTTWRTPTCTPRCRARSAASRPVRPPRAHPRPRRDEALEAPRRGSIAELREEDIPAEAVRSYLEELGLPRGDVHLDLTPQAAGRRGDRRSLRRGARRTGGRSARLRARSARRTRPCARPRRPPPRSRLRGAAASTSPETLTRSASCASRRR